MSIEEERERLRKRRQFIKYMGALHHSLEEEPDDDQSDTETARMLLCLGGGRLQGQDLTSGPFVHDATNLRLIEQQRRRIEFQERWNASR